MAPHHIWMWNADQPYRNQESIAEIRVRWRTRWYDGQSVTTLRDKIVARIAIEDG